MVPRQESPECQPRPVPRRPRRQRLPTRNPRRGTAERAEGVSRPQRCESPSPAVRAAARESSRLATLAQAIARTKPTAPNRLNSIVLSENVRRPPCPDPDPRSHPAGDSSTRIARPPSFAKAAFNSRCAWSSVIPGRTRAASLSASRSAAGSHASVSAPTKYRKCRRHDTDDHADSIREGDGPADDRRVSAERAPPVRVADQDGPSASDVLRSERPAHLRRDTHERGERGCESPNPRSEIRSGREEHRAGFAERLDAVEHLDNRAEALGGAAARPNQDSIPISASEIRRRHQQGGRRACMAAAGTKPRPAR